MGARRERREARQQLAREMYEELDRLIELVESGRAREVAQRTIWCPGCGENHPRWR